ncbi:MAG: right-handed parallel beta-helix repeat-containing protein [Acidimicrobiales bacterium]
MTSRRLAPLVALVMVLGAVGCGGDGAADGDSSSSSTTVPDHACRDAVASIVDATDRYVSGYEVAREIAASDATATDPSTATTSPAEGKEPLGEADFQSALSEADAALRSSGCDPAETRDDLTEGLASVSAEGPVADAVLRQLAASMTGRMARTPQVVTAAPGSDLRDVVSALPDGSTVELQAGEHRLDSSLVLLTGVTLRGTGRDATTLVSTAPDAAVLALTERRVELTGLTIRREGDAPGSAVLGGSAASVVLSKARLTGGKADADGQGGAGVLMYASGEEGAGRGTTLEVTDTEVRDNQAAGIVLSGGHRASVVRATFASNGQCGMCFLGASDGSVEDSTFDGNGLGVAATGTSKPGLLRLTITGGEVGVQAGDQAAPVIKDVTISAARRAGLIYTGEAAGSIDGVTCDGVPFGIVVGPEAHPLLGQTSCELAGT